MKFTKILAATMAAVTIASCSEQVTDLGGNIQPGDAVLSFKIGTSGVTTYATETDETAVNSLQAFLAYTDRSGAATFTEVTATTAGVTHTLTDGSYTPGSAKLYLVANKGVTVSTESELLALTDDKEIYTNNNGTLEIHSDGMTATRQVNINLQAGTISTGTNAGGGAVTGEVTLKRLAARVYASSTTATATDIAGYKVDFTGTAGEANLFSYAGSGTQATPQYTITGDATGQYPTATPTEAVGYVYPSTTDVKITVTHPSDNNITRDVTFKPESNKNYKLLITPSIGSTLSFTVKLEQYTDEDLAETADFGVTTKQADLSNLSLPTDMTVVNGAITIDAFANFSTGTNLDMAKLGYDAGATFKSIDKIDVATSTTRATDASKYLKVTIGTGTNLNIKTVPNTSGNDISVKVTVSGKDTNDAAIKTSFDVTLSTISPNTLQAMEKATVEIKGVKWVMFGTSGNLKADLQRAVDIDNIGGFALQSLTDISNKGKFLTTTAIITTGKCPIGYRVPTMSDFYALFGEHRTEVGAGTNGKWLATLGETKTFASGVVGKAEFFDTTNAYSVYSFTDGTNTLWMTGPKSYLSATSPNGSIAGITADANSVIRVAPWDNGIAYNTALKTATPFDNELRCVVDGNYNGLN